MLRAGRDINGAVTELYGRYGPVFAFGAGPLRFVWFVGPEANRFVLETAAEHFALGPAYGFLRTIGGDTALITSDEPEHRRRRRMVQPAFYRARLAQLDVLIGARLRELFTSWVGRTVDLYREVQGRVLELICEVLLGPAAVRTALTRDIARMMVFANLPFHLQLVKLPVPGGPWARFVVARSRADRALYAELGRRRAGALAAGDELLGDDVLGLLLAARDEQGQGLSDVEIRDQAISLVSAGFDTTSAAFSWTVYELLRQPALLTGLREGLEAVAEPPLLGYTVKEDVAPLPARSGRVAADDEGARVRRLHPSGGAAERLFNLRDAPAGKPLPGPAYFQPETLGDAHTAPLQLPAVRKRRALLYRRGFGDPHPDARVGHFAPRLRADPGVDRADS